MHPRAGRTALVSDHQWGKREGGVGARDIGVQEHEVGATGITTEDDLAWRSCRLSLTQQETKQGGMGVWHGRMSHDELRHEIEGHFSPGRKRLTIG